MRAVVAVFGGDVWGVRVVLLVEVAAQVGGAEKDEGEILFVVGGGVEGEAEGEEAEFEVAGLHCWVFWGSGCGGGRSRWGSMRRFVNVEGVNDIGVEASISEF